MARDVLRVRSRQLSRLLPARRIQFHRQRSGALNRTESIPVPTRSLLRTILIKVVENRRYLEQAPCPFRKYKGYEGKDMIDTIICSHKYTPSPTNFARNTAFPLMSHEAKADAGLAPCSQRLGKPCKGTLNLGIRNDTTSNPMPLSRHPTTTNVRAVSISHLAHLLPKEEWDC